MSLEPRHHISFKLNGCKFPLLRCDHAGLTKHIKISHRYTFQTIIAGCKLKSSLHFYYRLPDLSLLATQLFSPIPPLLVSFFLDISVVRLFLVPYILCLNLPAVYRRSVLKWSIYRCKQMQQLSLEKKSWALPNGCYYKELSLQFVWMKMYHQV